MLQHAPLPILPSDSDEAFGYVYNVPPEALVADLRVAVNGQLALKGFDFLCGDGRTPLHLQQENILRIQDVWGGYSPCVRIRCAGSDYGKHIIHCFGWFGQHAHLPGHCLVTPILATVAATLFSFAVGMVGLCLAQVAHTARGGIHGASVAAPAADGAAFLGAKVPAANGDPVMPMDDYQYYLYTFLKVWEATLNALVSMINTYLNGPVMVLCHMGEQIINCVEKCMLAYVEAFKFCWEVILNCLASMINNYVSGPVVQLCHSLDNVIRAVQDTVLKYLEVFATCFTAAMRPDHTLLFIGMTIVVFLGTALVIDVALKDARRFLPWVPPCCQRRRKPKSDAEQPMMMSP